MLRETEIQFIHKVLTQPPNQTVEEISSEIHETHRLPDPYIFVFQEGKLKTPNGIKIEEKIDLIDQRSQWEMMAFQKIQKWGNENDRGTAVWFSPPYPGVQTSKFIFSDIFILDGRKGIFNRVVVLDTDADTLLTLANTLSSHFRLENPEDLRAVPAFPTDEEFAVWFENLTPITTQVELVQTGQDLALKTDTYANVTEVKSSVALYRSPHYKHVYWEAKSRKMYGPNPSSCPSVIGGQSAFETFFSHALFAGAVKELKCTCPFCQAKVTAKIENGTIHCPSCGKSAPYKC